MTATPTCDILRAEGISVGRRHITTLMRRMGIEAIYRKPRTSDKHPGHRIIPYLLRDVVIDRANQTWALDTTYGTPRQRSRPVRRRSCLSMFGMQRSMEVKLR